MKVIVSTGEHSVVFNDADGVALLRMIGKAHESYLGRGESAQTIKALAVLASSDNTGRVLFAPKLVAFAARVVSEHLTVKCLAMNATNDKVVLTRYDKDGVRKTNELLASSKAHVEVLALTRLLHILTEASLRYDSVHFYRQEEPKAAEVTSIEDYRNRQQETLPIVCTQVVNQSATVTVPAVSEMEDAMSLVITLIGRALTFDHGHSFVVVELLEEKEREQFNTQADKSRIGRIFSDIVYGIGSVKYVWPEDKKIIRADSELCSPRRYTIVKVED